MTISKESEPKAPHDTKIISSAVFALKMDSELFPRQEVDDTKVVTIKTNKRNFLLWQSATSWCFNCLANNLLEKPKEVPDEVREDIWQDFIMGQAQSSGYFESMEDNIVFKSMRENPSEWLNFGDTLVDVKMTGRFARMIVGALNTASCQFDILFDHREKLSLKEKYKLRRDSYAYSENMVNILDQLVRQDVEIGSAAHVITRDYNLKQKDDFYRVEEAIKAAGINVDQIY